MSVTSQTMTESTTFPVPWQTPFDDGEPFLHDPMHMPFAITPLTRAMMAEATGTGMTAAAAEAGIPITSYDTRERNYYHFTRIALVVPSSEEEAREIGARAEAVGQREVARQMERWHGEHLPRLQQLNARLAELAAQDAAEFDALAALDEAKANVTEAWTIHFRLAFPMLLSMQIFDEFYADLFGGNEADGHALLVGGVSESVKAGFGISDLAVLAREQGLEPMFLATPPDALVPALEGTQAGQTFLAALQDYLAAYGLRQDLFDLATPTWQEDPGFALAAVRA